MEWLIDLLGEDVEKYVFGYPAGKSRMKVGLVKMIPTHKTYVEPFCGSAAVFFHKEASEKEVLSDMNADVIGTFQAIQSMTESEAKALAKRDWTGDRAKFKSLYASKPTGKMDRLYRFLYLAAHSYGLNRRSFNPGKQGKSSGIADRAIKARERLKGVTLKVGSYVDIVKEYDSKDTVFFFDPPYAGYNVHIGESKFDEEEMRKVLKSIKGKFILTYGVKGKADFGGFNVQRVAQFRSLSTMRGVSRDKVLMTLVVTNFKGAVYKAFEGTGLEIDEPRLIVDMARVEKRSSGGMHAHMIDRKAKETAVDGNHTHLFMLPGKKGERARFAMTLCDGPHQHKLPKPDADDTVVGGEHTHKVRFYSDFDSYMDNAQILTTDKGGEHDHELGVSMTAYDGSHEHVMQYEGAPLKSISPGEYSALSMKKDDPYSAIPLDDKQLVASMKVRKVEGGSSFVDLWFDNGGEAFGWAFDIVKTPVAKAQEAADRFSTTGDRVFASLEHPVRAERLGTLDAGILTLEGEIEKGEIGHVDCCLFEHGLHTDVSHEYFFAKGDELVGVLDLLVGESGWEARLRKSDLVPLVMRTMAIVEKRLPPAGVSGLPSTLEALVPSDLRYWQEPDRARALEKRDALAASGFFARDKLAIVDGAIRKVERVIDLYEQSDAAPLPDDWFVEKIAEHFDEIPEVIDLRKATGSDVHVDGDCVVVANDDEATRDLLAKLGMRTFGFVPDHVEHAIEITNTLFATTMPLRKTDDVRWLDPPIPDPEESQIDARRVEDELAKHTSEIRIVEVDKAEEDRRFVLGIVLEPETRDSQGDIYSAEEIEKAAHGFMAEYRNVGLMHRKLVNGKVSIVESYLAPADFSVGKQKVKKGAWVMGTIVTDDDLWKSVKAGELTGYSIGGSAIRTPDRRS